MQRRDLSRRRAERRMRVWRAKWSHRFRRLKRAVIASFLILFGAAAWAVAFGGLGDGVLVLVLMGAIAAFFVLAIFPRTSTPGVDDLHHAGIAELAMQTELWLEAQRRALPASLHPTLDLVGARLDALSPQLASLPEKGEAAREIRKLLGVHLPALVNSYTSIPADLRGEDHAGSTPHEQVGQGLSIVAREIETVTHQIARGELDQLAIRGRYLETRYVDPGDDQDA